MTSPTSWCRLNTWSNWNPYPPDESAPVTEEAPAEAPAEEPEPVEPEPEPAPKVKRRTVKKSTARES